MAPSEADIILFSDRQVMMMIITTSGDFLFSP